MRALGRLFDIISNVVPVDTQTAANPGDYICLKNVHGVSYVLFKGAGTANDDPVLTFRQATDAAGSDVKDLAVVTTYYQKQAATNLLSTGTWTKVTQAAGATVTLNATSAEQVGLYVIEIEADQLDADNGFDWVICNLGDTGSAGAQLGCMLAILHSLGVEAAPENLPSAIA